MSLINVPELWQLVSDKSVDLSNRCEFKNKTWLTKNQVAILVISNKVNKESVNFPKNDKNCVFQRK